ncbi:NotI family restriction endonuclease [Sulfitobacter sp. D7]|uniref:NotI family restriction endonuclease n=1 Tax=Sulfitobacter sp. D7 TaxID=1968541 RepID=UPI000E7749D4|nr:NotI family restriction endonuclease [Sulfitobacter sp. D7]AYE86722.1 hypothetical protein B5M07_11705 [Sulfitobacter sp. D7]
MLKNGPLELFGASTLTPCDATKEPWQSLRAETVSAPHKNIVCPFKQGLAGMYQHTPTGTNCDKIRKAKPNPLIGNCTVRKTKADGSVQNWMVCPSRFLQDAVILEDCKRFLTSGHSYRAVRELSITSEGSLDFGLTALDQSGEVIDFVGIEVQACGTGGSGSIWDARNDYLNGAIKSSYAFSLNEKDASKKILVQLLHKARQVARWRKNTVLIVQDHFLEHLRKSYNVDAHFHQQDPSDFIHIHAYRHITSGMGFKIELAEAISTDMVGLSMALISNPGIKLHNYDKLSQAISARFADGKFSKI